MILFKLLSHFPGVHELNRFVQFVRERSHCCVEKSQWQMNYEGFYTNESQNHLQIETSPHLLI